MSAFAMHARWAMLDAPPGVDSTRRYVVDFLPCRSTSLRPGSGASGVSCRHAATAGCAARLSDRTATRGLRLIFADAAATASPPRDGPAPDAAACRTP